MARTTSLLASSLSGQVALANGGTGANLTDPNADRILFWDDSAGAMTWLTAGSGLTIADTTITASATIADGDKWDITVSASGATWTIDNGAVSLAKTTGVAGSGANTDITSVYLNNTGLKIKDTNATHGLSIVPWSDLTADHTLTVTTGDADRTIDLSAWSMTAPTGTVVGTTDVQTLTGKTIQYPTTLSSDDTVQGITTSRVAWATTAQWEVGYMAATGKVLLADASAYSTSSALFLATAAITADVAGIYLLHGIARNDAWNWTVWGLLYLSETAGAITQTAPVTTDSVTQILGIALDADTIYWKPEILGQVEHT